MISSIDRRAILTALGGVALTWPLAARAQAPDRMRRVGVLMNTTDDSLGQSWFAAFVQSLQQLGWQPGRNVQIDTRWGAYDTERFRRYATELVALAPDVIVGTANSIVADLQQASRTIPIVFVSIVDPVGSGYVDHECIGKYLNIGGEGHATAVLDQGSVVEIETAAEILG